MDETNLAGAWDFTIKWTSRNQLEKQGADGISIFAAVEKQLGLKLELKPLLASSSRSQASTKSHPQRRQPRRSPSRAARSPLRGHRHQAQRSRREGLRPHHRWPDRNPRNPLTFLITFGWDLNPNNKEGIVNAPKWLDTNKYDILAKAGAQRSRRQVLLRQPHQLRRPPQYAPGHDH